MKTNGFISNLNRVLSRIEAVVWYLFTGVTSVLMGISILLIQQPASSWYVAFLSIFFFTYSLVGTDKFKLWPKASVSDESESEYFRPFNITSYGRSNRANGLNEERVA